MNIGGDSGVGRQAVPTILSHCGTATEAVIQIQKRGPAFRAGPLSRL